MRGRARPPGGLFALLLAALGALAPVAAVEIVERLPNHRSQVYIARSDEQPADFRYLAFPSVLVMAPDEIWVAYKAGRSHAHDVGAAIVVASHRLSTGATKVLQVLKPPAGEIYQNVELGRLADGAVTVNIDVQRSGRPKENAVFRKGAVTFRWHPEQRVFTGPVAFAAINGVLYGYPFDFVTEGKTTWQLNMTFEYLPGGRRSVDVLRSDNNGATWSFVRNLSQEFGNIRSNESGFMRYQDGFIVVTRTYGHHLLLHRTDREFRPKLQADLTELYPFVNSPTGRPRVYTRDGNGYIISRNRVRAANKHMQLSLFRFDRDTLAVTGHVVLDNREDAVVGDGYYAVPVWAERDGRTWLHVVTYTGRGSPSPQIVRFDYLWDEIK
jgi:hypothetical protein